MELYQSNKSMMKGIFMQVNSYLTRLQAAAADLFFAFPTTGLKRNVLPDCFLTMYLKSRLEYFF